ncbi:MAG: serine/threonine protein kinase [Thermoanaerobaculia bacterium]|nr:serine/threonine protein kinase [Thermoanaerobaculia bacterium]
MSLRVTEPATASWFPSESWPQSVPSPTNHDLATFAEDLWTVASDREERREAALPPGTMLRGRYRLGEVLGEGGYGVVYAARDTVLRQEVALKILHRRRSAMRSLTRFRRELQVSFDVVHPNLLRLRDLNWDHGDLFLVMDRIQGTDLRRRLHKGPLAVDEATAVVRQILIGLGALHRKGFVHRDLKPGNVLLDGSRVVLADFGLAQPVTGAGESRVTDSDAVVGTLEYLAPEQLCGAPASAASDLYACGLLFHQMLTGRLPFERLAGRAALRRRLLGGTPRLDFGEASVPAWLARLIARLLELHPEDRYASADEVLEDLDRRRTPRRSARVSSGLAVGPLAATLLGLVLIGSWVTSDLGSGSRSRFGSGLVTSRTLPATSWNQSARSTLEVPIAAPVVEAHPEEGGTGVGVGAILDVDVLSSGPDVSGLDVETEMGRQVERGVADFPTQARDEAKLVLASQLGGG